MPAFHGRFLTRDEITDVPVLDLYPAMLCCANDPVAHQTNQPEYMCGILRKCYCYCALRLFVRSIAGYLFIRSIRGYIVPDGPDFAEHRCALRLGLPI